MIRTSSAGRGEKKGDRWDPLRGELSCSHPEGDRFLRTGSGSLAIAEERPPDVDGGGPDPLSPPG